MRDYYMGLLPLNGSISLYGCIGLLMCIFSGYIVVTVIEAVYHYICG